VELHPFGGVARIRSAFATEPEAEFFVAAAGPAFNLLLACAAALAVYLHPGLHAQLFLETNLCLALFNLLPALPLDGGRMLRAMLCRIMPVKKATVITAALGIAAGSALSLLGICMALRQQGNFTYACVGILLLLTAARELRSKAYGAAQQLEYMQHRMHDEKAIFVRHLAVPWHMTLGQVFGLFVPNRYHIVHIIGESGASAGEADEGRLFAAAAQLGMQARVLRVLQQEKKK